MTTKKSPKKAVKKATVIAGRGNVFQFKVNEAVVIEVGQGRGCIGRVMSLDPPNGYVKVRLGGSTHYQYAPENIRSLDINSDLAPGTIVMFKRDDIEYTIKRAFRMDDTTCAMVCEVPYHVSLEGWRIHQEEPVEMLNEGERAQYESFRAITYRVVENCTNLGLTGGFAIHTLPLDQQLNHCAELLLKAHNQLQLKLNTIRSTAG